MSKEIVIEEKLKLDIKTYKQLKKDAESLQKKILRWP